MPEPQDASIRSRNASARACELVSIRSALGGHLYPADDRLLTVRPCRVVGTQEHVRRRILAGDCLLCALHLRDAGLDCRLGPGCDLEVVHREQQGVAVPVAQIGWHRAAHVEVFDGLLPVPDQVRPKPASRRRSTGTARLRRRRARARRTTSAVSTRIGGLPARRRERAERSCLHLSVIV